MSIRVVISTLNDGSMLIPEDETNEIIIDNRTKFLFAHTINPENTTRVRITYQGMNYCQYREVGQNDKGKGMFSGEIDRADGLVTCTKNHALFLPLADCVGAVLYDPALNVLMVTHLGRHSVEQNGGYASVKFLTEQYRCDPSKLLVWLTPAPDKENYPLFAFDNASFKEVVCRQLAAAGILSAHITDNPADTTTDSRFYSHSEFLRGNQNDDGRYAVVACMTD